MFCWDYKLLNKNVMETAAVEDFKLQARGKIAMAFREIVSVF